VVVSVKALTLDPAVADLPKIETMKVENVIAAVVKEKGGCGDGICGAGECDGGDDPESAGGRAEDRGRGHSGAQKLPTSLMPPGLMNQLTVKDFASLLDYLEVLAKEQKK